KNRKNKTQYQTVKFRYGYKSFIYTCWMLLYLYNIVCTKSTQGNKILYALIVLLFPIIGISIYYLIRK
ncbi:PLDc_N domain-containing protein, partial [Bacteroides sp. AM44-19]